MGPTPTIFGAETADIDAAGRRSALLHIDPEISEIPHVGEPPEGARIIRRLSQPVLDDLIAQVADGPLGVVLADRHGGLTWRDAGSAATLAAMDARSLDIGRSLAESDVGTNGVGTSLETRLPTVVVGDEHHLDCFKGFTCVNAPIIHPITRRLEGTVGIVCPVEETGPLLLPTALQLSAEIGRILIEHATPDERFLLEQFLLQRGRSKRATATIGEGVLIATPAAQHELLGVDHAELWEQVQRAVRSGDGGSTDVDIDQPSSPTLHLRCRPLFRDGEFGGATVELVSRPASGSTGRIRGVEQLGDLVGVSDAWHSLVRDAHRAALLDVPVLVAGERGSGRLSIAREIAGLHGTEPVTVFDSGSVLIDGARAWVVAVSDALAGGGVVVLRRVDELPDHVAAALASVISRGVSARVLATAEHTSADGPGVAALLDRLDVVRIAVPPLRERRDDIAPLVRHLSGRLGLRTIEPQAVKVLYRQAWPGNVTELAQVLRSAQATATTGDVGVRDLPHRARLARATRPLHGIQQHEADAIVAALRTTSTRREAAQMLGISRATLYRRIDAYGLDADEI